MAPRLARRGKIILFLYVVALEKDVFVLIYPELTTKKNRNAKKNNEERKTRVQAWLSDAIQAVSEEEFPWSDQENVIRQSMNLIPQFMQLLRECMLTHQWSQVLSMLDSISHIPYGADWTIWKATLTTIYTEAEANIGLAEDFFKHSYLLQECNVRDIVLEFVQYLISQGLTQEASQAIQNSRKVRKGVSHHRQSDFTQHLITLLDAYQGLIFYVDWKAAINAKSALPQNLSQSFYNLTTSQGLSDEAILARAKRALVGLDSLPQQSGVWDIFLTKSVEIHEYYHQYEEARNLLCAYQERNPNNPNAHRLLYEFLQRNHEHLDQETLQQESINCLKCLAEVDQTNPLLLTLWETLTDLGETTQALQYLFDLLDNVIWQNRLEGWQCLAKALTACFSGKRSEKEQLEVNEALVMCWSVRKDWWPAYHFSPELATHTSSEELLLAKCISASLLIGKDCGYIQKARKTMSDGAVHRLEEAALNLNFNMAERLFEISKQVPSGTGTAQSNSEQSEDLNTSDESVMLGDLSDTDSSSDL